MQRSVKNDGGASRSVALDRDLNLGSPTWRDVSRSDERPVHDVLSPGEMENRRRRRQPDPGRLRQRAHAELCDRPLKRPERMMDVHAAQPARPIDGEETVSLAE